MPPPPVVAPGGLIDPQSVQASSSSSIHPAVSGTNTDGGDGVRGISTGGTGTGVRGFGHNGVYGTSGTGDGVLGVSEAPQHAGVSAINDKGGFGLWARAARAGHFEGDVAVRGNITVNGKDYDDAILSVSRSPENAAVSAINDQGGFGLWVRSQRAGHFEGNVTVTGSLRANGLVVEAELRQLHQMFETVSASANIAARLANETQRLAADIQGLLSRISSLESRVARLEAGGSTSSGPSPQGRLTVNKEPVPWTNLKTFVVSGSSFPPLAAVVLSILQRGNPTPAQLQITTDNQGSFSNVNTGRTCDSTGNSSYDFSVKSTSGQTLATVSNVSC